MTPSVTPENYTTLTDVTQNTRSVAPPDDRMPIQSLANHCRQVQFLDYSTTKRVGCFLGSHSPTDRGRRNPASRSIARKLLINAVLTNQKFQRCDSTPCHPVPLSPTGR